MDTMKRKTKWKLSEADRWELKVCLVTAVIIVSILGSYIYGW